MESTLETERLVLRPVARCDLADYVRLYGDPRVMRHVGNGNPLSPEEAADRVARMIDYWRRNGHGFWSVFARADGRFLGRCGLGTGHECGERELSYTFLCCTWGQGYATESARRVVRHAFEDMRLRRLIALARPDNVASRRVMEKLGMRYEGESHCQGGPAVTYGLEPAGFLAGPVATRP